MQYIANVPLAYKGSRFERGAPVEMTAAEAANFGSDVTAVGAVAEPEEEVDETEGLALEELTVPQLKEKAKALGLSVSGSKADLIERLTLGADAAPEEEVAEELAD